MPPLQKILVWAGRHGQDISVQLLPATVVHVQAGDQTKQATIDPSVTRREARQICADFWGQNPKIRLLKLQANGKTKTWVRPVHTIEKVDLYQGDCLDVLKALPSESVEAVVTDPPYGLSKHDAKDVAEALRCWLSGELYQHKSAGFMSKTWDSFVPGPEVWREVLRVLKPGGHLLVFAGTRTMDLMGLAVRLAGFELRDSIMVQGILSWYQGQGFPKSTDVSKRIDKEAGVERTEVVGTRHRNVKPYDDEAGWNQNNTTGDHQYRIYKAPATDAAKQYAGWGSALKPSNEPILIFRKILDGTLAHNTLAHGCGGLNIDACRLDTSDKLSISSADPFHGADGSQCTWNPTSSGAIAREQHKGGRFPPNALFCHLPGCQQVGTKQVKGDARGKPGGRRNGGFAAVGADKGDSLPNAAVYGDSEVGKWVCAEGCPVAALDQQAGTRKSGSGNFKQTSAKGGKQSQSIGAESRAFGTEMISYGDKGEVSRFFPCFPGEEPPFFYTSKASTAERNRGVEGPMGHPTTKPVAIMEWLLKLVVPPGGTVLDPFAGSGTTGVAARRLGFGAILIERDPQYCEWAQQRVAAALTLDKKGKQQKIGAEVPAEITSIWMPT